MVSQDRVSKREWARAKASRIVTLTADEARALPGMLAKIVPFELSRVGWYATEHNGVVTYYEATVRA